MVKSKKLTRSSLAVLLLALMLALSMVVGITGAWFTDSIANTGNNSAEMQFGKVDIDLASGSTYLAEVTKCTDAKLVDSCGFTIAFGQVQNNSDVAIYYQLSYSYDVAAKAGDTLTSEQIAQIKSWFGFTEASNADVIYLAANANAPAKHANVECTFQSNGDANVAAYWGHEIVVSVTVTAKAMQVDHAHYNDVNSFFGSNFADDAALPTA